MILGAVVNATISRQFFPALFETGNKKTAQKETDEKAYCINMYTLAPKTSFQPLWFGKQVGVGVLLWTIPWVAFYFLASDFEFWRKVSFFFTQAAFVTFGSAYAVLPYVVQVSVEKFNWLTNLQMIDGLALGETTPDL